jgi:hypothetical protein
MKPNPIEALSEAEHEFSQYRLDNMNQSEIDVDLALAQVRCLASIAVSLEKIAALLSKRKP